MSQKKKLTKTLVEGFRARDRREIYWDAGDGSTKGFGVKVEPSGKKVFIFQYRMGGRDTPTRRYTIGAYGKGLTVEHARRIAEDLERKVSSGVDPAEKLKADNREKKEAKAVAETAKKGRVELVVKRYLHTIENQVPPFRSLKERRRTLTTDVVGTEEKPGPWRGRLINEITKDDVRDLLKKRPKRSIRHLQVALSALFEFAKDDEYAKCKQNPAYKFKLKSLGYEPLARDRHLSPEELRAVWLAAAATAYPYGPLFQLLILTAQRKSEIGEALWSEFNGDGLTPWRIGAQRAKNNTAHIVHLSPAALKVFSRIERQGPLLFPASSGKPVSGYSKAFSALVKASGVRDWRLHDLRRTFATIAAELLKVPPHVVDKVLSHKSGAISGVAAVYQRAEFLEERKAALDAWGIFVSSLAANGSSAGIKEAVSRAAAHYQDASRIDPRPLLRVFS